MLEQSSQSPVVSPAAVLTAQILFGLTLAVPINSLFPLGEEFGWRGYLLPRSMTLLGPWQELLFHGAVWGVWQAGLLFLAGYNDPGHNLLGVPLFLVFCVLAGALLAWLYLASGSIVAPTIAHATLNAIGGTPLVLLRDVDPAVGGVVYSPLGWIVLSIAVALTFRFGGLSSLLHRSRSSTAIGRSERS
jgi:membrane protease YdiL (CAAX protease family)